jgi:hypothetical protein
MAEFEDTASEDDDDDDENNMKANHIDDVDDDELEQLARINAKFNSNNLTEKPLQPKGRNFKPYLPTLLSNAFSDFSSGHFFP